MVSLQQVSVADGALVDKPSFSFSFDGFRKDPTFDSEFELLGDAEVRDSTVKMIPAKNSTSAVLLHRFPLDFGRKPSFSVDFSYSSQQGNGGIALMIAPANVPKKSFVSNHFGLSDGVFAVEFDTKMDSESQDPNGNHIGIDIGSSVSIQTFNVSAVKINLSSGEKLHAWVDFDGDLNILEVRLNTSSSRSRPSDPLVSYPIDLSGTIWQDAMFVGLVSSTSWNVVYSWSFRLKHAVPYMLHSHPLDPTQMQFVVHPRSKQQPFAGRQREDQVPVIFMALAFGAACGAAVAFLVLFAWSSTVERNTVAPLDGEFGYKKIAVVGVRKGLENGVTE